MASDELHDAPFDASDSVAENNARREATRRERADLDVLRAIMHQKKGRDWLYRLLDSCHINNTPFTAGHPDVTAFHLGEENVGRKILMQAMAASVDLYMKMIKEQQEDEIERAAVRRKEQRNREEREGPIDVAAMVAPLPPPAGYPGGPPLPKKDKK